MTKYAIDGGPGITARPVASDTTFHSDFTLEIDKRSGYRFHQILHFPMTGLAKNLTGHNVAAMGEVDVVRNQGHLLPRDGITTGEPLNQSGFLRALTYCFIVAIGTHV